MWRASLISFIESLWLDLNCMTAPSAGFWDMLNVSEKIFSTAIGALVGRPRDTILARTASLESQSFRLSSSLFDLTSKTDSELNSPSVSASISDLAYSSAMESRIYPAKNWSFLWDSSMRLRMFWILSILQNSLKNTRSDMVHSFFHVPRSLSAMAYISSGSVAAMKSSTLLLLE